MNAILSVWIGFLLPKGAAPDVTQRLNEAFNAVLKDPGFAQDMSGLGVVPQATTPQAFEHMLVEEAGKWKQIVRNAGLKPE